MTIPEALGIIASEASEDAEERRVVDVASVRIQRRRSR